MKRFTIVNLGCPKNVVDSEIILGKLEEAGYEYSEDGEIVIINTCGFIEPAIKESEGEILEQIRRKLKGEVEKVIIAGCLVQRKKSELLNKFPEADAIIGHDDIPFIVDIIEGRRKPKVFENPRYLPTSRMPRYVSTRYYAYVKIGEGCSRRCTFCTIPYIRGNFRSRSIEDIVHEVQELSEIGIREVILVAQDLTLYGYDIYRRNALVELLESIERVEGIEWIRLMYVHPFGLTLNRELVDYLRSSSKIVPYIELPIQHVSDRILKLMSRTGGKRAVEEALKLLEGFAIRTEVIVGFPGEKDSEFDELVDFLYSSNFARIGVFPYYREKGTLSYNYSPQIDEREKQWRYEIASEVAHSKFMHFQRNLRGKTLEVLFEDYEDGYLVGRSMYDAPEVDGRVITKDIRKYKLGEIYSVKVKDVSKEGDLIV